MTLNYQEVPNNIATGKDLDYLSDMFEWNYGALKKTNNDKKEVTDEEIIQVFNEASTLFDDNLKNILRILESRGETNG